MVSKGIEGHPKTIWKAELRLEWSLIQAPIWDVNEELPPPCHTDLRSKAEACTLEDLIVSAGKLLFQPQYPFKVSPKPASYSCASANGISAFQT